MLPVTIFELPLEPRISNLKLTIRILQSPNERQEIIDTHAAPSLVPVEVSASIPG
tara:strand:- start:4424 stop:4588 length:165 start_codon:yes stop_codon:yes gene_type:complete